jgi:hypothetical protein
MKNWSPTFLWYNTDCVENDVSNNSSFVACIFVVMFLPSSCLAVIGIYTYRHTDWWKGFIKYAIEMGSEPIIYILNFTKIGSGNQKLMGGGFSDTQDGDLKNLLIFSQFFLFQEIKAGILAHCTVSVNPPPTNFWNPEPVFMKQGMYIMATEPISVAYFINPSISLCVCICILPSCWRQIINKLSHMNHTACRETVPSSGLQVNFFSSFQTLLADSSAEF